MKIIGSVKEDLSFEKRVSITPEVVKKFIKLGFSINLEKKYGEHLGINDEDYKKNGANINLNKEEVFKKSEIILRVNCLSEDESNIIKSNSILIGQFDLDSNKNLINKLIKSGIKIFSLTIKLPFLLK